MPAQRRHRAFTMLELMTVIAIIILVLAMAVPVVRSIEGSRSVEAGYNRVSAAIGHARQIALFNRAPAGVVFYKYGNNPEILAFVEQAKLISGNSSTLDDRAMEIIPGEEVVTMPPGVAVQLLSAVNPLVLPASATAVPERYLRAGIILFDENGQLVTTPYWIPPPYGAASAYYQSAVDLGFNLQVSAAGMAPTSPPLCGSPAICLYDDDAYRSQVEPVSGMSFSQIDDTTNSFDTTAYGQLAMGYIGPLPSTGVTPNPPLPSQKISEMTWLDQNGETLVIKPNDGSLLRNQ